jgi:hypothetical protein
MDIACPSGLAPSSRVSSLLVSSFFVYSITILGVFRAPSSLFESRDIFTRERSLSFYPYLNLHLQPSRDITTE